MNIKKLYTLKLFSLVIGCTYSFDVISETEDTGYQQRAPVAKEWLNKKHEEISDNLDRVATAFDSVFDRNNKFQIDEQATATVKVILNTNWDQYNKVKIKPKIRAQIKLVKLNQRFLHLVVGDNSVDDVRYQSRNDKNNKKQQKKSFKEKYIKDSIGLALQWSVLKTKYLKYHFDLGVTKIINPYIRFRSSFSHDLSKIDLMEISTLVQYGTQTQFNNVNSLFFEHKLDQDNFLINMTKLSYSKKNREAKTIWENSTYFTTFLSNKRELNYGITVFGKRQNNKFKMTGYGPFISYNCPIYKDWVFLNSYINYFNDKELARKHYPSIGITLETIF